MTNNKELDKEFDKFLEKYIPRKQWGIFRYDIIKTFIQEKLKSQKETLCLEYDKQYLKREEKLIEKINKKEKRDIIQDYTDWLCKTGYTDSDVYTEEPKAVDRYLDEKELNKK